MADNEDQANLIVSAVNEATQVLGDIQKSFEDFEGSAGKLGITSVTLGNILSQVLMKAFEELKDMVKLGINEAIDAEQQQVKLTQAFKAEGDAAQDSVASVNAAADALGGLIGVDNDVIVANAAVVRQLTGLSSEAINRLLPAIGDLATRTGSWESATTLLSRAINGQEMGLSRMGIQVDLTKDKAENLERVIAAVNERFGGQAQANMKTTGGQLQNLKVVFTDVAQNIGEAVIQSDLFRAAVFALTAGLDKLKSLTSHTKNTAKEIEHLKAVTREYNNEFHKGMEAGLQLPKDVVTALNSLAAKQDEHTQKKKELSNEELETISNNLELEVEAEQYALEQIQALNEKYKTDSSAPTFEPMTDAQLAMIQTVEASLQTTGNSIRIFYADIEQTISNSMLAITDVAMASIGYFTNLLPILYANMLNTTKSGLDKMKDFWAGFVAVVLAELNRVLVKLLVIKAATAIFNAAGGVGPIADLMTGLMGFQTPEGSTRVLPGPPNMPVPFIGHGGETVGRPAASGGSGLTVVVQGDYFESEDANAKLFDRVRRYGKDTGLSIG